MAGATPLSALNRSSANVAQFPIRVHQPKKTTYQYTQKRGSREVTAHKMECVLLGPSDTDGTMAYATAIMKGTEEFVDRAMQRFGNGTKWVMSKVVFDSLNATYLSAPLRFRVDLGKTVVAALDSNETPVRLATYPVPPRTVAEAAGISDSRSTDLLAMVKSQTAPRPTKTGVVADVELVDGSTMPDGKLASISVSVFGVSKLDLFRSSRNPMVFFNLSVKVQGRAREIIHWPAERVFEAPECEKTTELRSSFDALRSETNTHAITTSWEPSEKKRDVSGMQPLSCCAFLDFTSESPEAKVPNIVQINWAPCGGTAARPAGH